MQLHLAYRYIKIRGLIRHTFYENLPKLIVTKHKINAVYFFVLLFLDLGYCCRLFQRNSLKIDFRTRSFSQWIFLKFKYWQLIYSVSKQTKYHKKVMKFVKSRSYLQIQSFRCWLALSYDTILSKIGLMV